jgi:DNA repair ATPase RecN
MFPPSGADQTGSESFKGGEDRETERKELFSFVHREIDEAGLTPGEEETLKKEKQLFKRRRTDENTHEAYEKSLQAGTRR